MVKKELVSEVAKVSGVSKQDTQIVIDTMIDTIKSKLLFGVNVKITDFIDFKLEVAKARNGINPNTKEKIVIPKKYRVKVTLPKKFIDKIKAKPVY
jgi:DNA-binding protein HU-beta